ncbi:MAG: DUF3019 domain-containing protein [Pseudohongiella sp.]|nr:DUF3019 domain-containing protein [Pseudohongiella sp.]MDO9518737.1 DUF3019 domain-containing protein [Pseudohongiella sp.]MDP2126775.1 DUF3019 domain-containing protein [Pseudohongiella sp.]
MVSIFTWSGTETDTANKAVGLSIARRLLLILVLLTGTPASLQAAPNEQGVTLRVQPRICVIPADEQTCSMRILVTWTTANNRDVCLHYAQDTEFLQCWQAQQSGEFSMAVARLENINLHLLDAQTLEVLSEVEIPVIKRDLRDTRRRRRHAWSVF